MKPKTPDKFRVRLGDRFCSLNMGFHELGCCIPDSTIETCHVFTNLNACNHAVERTHEVRQQVKDSLHSGFKLLQPILFEGELGIERFNDDGRVEAV